MLKSFFFAGHVILNKDPSVWLGGVIPTNTCIIPILPRVHAWMAKQHTHPQKYVCKYIKMTVCSIKEITKKNNFTILLVIEGATENCNCQ